MLTSIRTLSLCAALACAASSALAQSSQRAQQQQQGATAVPPRDDALRQELLRMRDAAQALRERMTDEEWRNDTLSQEIVTLDMKHTKRLFEIFEAHGYPAIKSVGHEGAEAVLMLVLNVPSSELQKRALAYLKEARQRGEAIPDDEAGLTDFILHDREDKPQIYGTRFKIVGGKIIIGKIKDPAHLHARRAKLGLMPMGAYIKLLEESYKMPVDTASIPR